MTNQKNTNFIADTFNWARQVIESAETPFAMFAILILPILAPAVPASVTGMRLHSQLHWYPVMAITAAVVLELLGYASAILLIKSISRRFRQEGSFLSIFTSGIAYFFYLFIMYTVNVRLGELSGESLVANQIFALLSFLTVPTGLLAAESINERSEKEEKEKLRQERRQDSLERLRIRQGANGSSERSEQNHRTPNEHRTNSSVNGSAANKANEIRSFVRYVQETEQRTPRVSEIAKVLGVAKSYASETLKVILNEQSEN